MPASPVGLLIIVHVRTRPAAEDGQGVFQRRCWHPANRIRQNHESNSQVPSQHRAVSNEVGRCGRLDEIGFLSGARRLLFMERPTWILGADHT